MTQNKKNIPAFILAGTNSGCGKTTTTLALLALLKQQRHTVQSFKTGPDYIDPAFHSQVLKRPSYNLDTQMLSSDACKYLFHKHSQKADIAVVEGVMGLYDGMGSEAKGSTAELAKTLKLPVILVASAKGMYQSVAALIKGFVEYDRELNISGVILNHVGSEAVYNAIKGFVEENTGIPCIGYLPHVADAELESRHLGLIQAEEVEELNRKVEQLRDAFANTIDIPRLLELAKTANVPSPKNFAPANWQCNLTGFKLAIARDVAFSFYYHDNLELLQESGAELLFFSPLKDKKLPEECHAVYFGGGYPEVFADQLSQNENMLTDIQQATERGMPMFAECGGLMYLCSAIEDIQGRKYTMSNIFNAEVKMSKRLKRFGYCEVNLEGEKSSAHEFHRSDVEHAEEPNYELAFSVEKPNKSRKWQCGLRYKNVLAGYPHIHFYSSASFYQKIIELWTQHI